MININTRLKVLLIIWLSAFSTTSLLAQTIVNTVHNMSVSGTGSLKASVESEICIFCHTPHNSTPAGPLWNRNNPGLNYSLYKSSTAQAIPGQPDGSSILCLSCHDGTIALGNVVSRTNPIEFSSVSTMPHNNKNLSTNLEDDHMVSFVYDASLATANGQLLDPDNITKPVSLESSKVQCTSCHDPHKNFYSDFLVTSTQYSALCLSCHSTSNWTTSSHRTSTSGWNGSGVNPWQHTEYTTVAENACENCHNPHNAGGKERLMKYNAEENNCLDCHNSNVASSNIEVQLTKSYGHNVYAYSGIHDPVEEPIVNNKHVECSDCHNPHAAKKLDAVAPNVNGYNVGVMGVSQNGNPVSTSQYEYEICYRCHSESLDKPSSPTTRRIEQNNVRLEFDQGNPSHHAVTGPGSNSNVPSLIAPLSESSMIYCTDCHASDGANSPQGPHGSIYPHILKLRYETGSNTPETATSYALCYSCHDRNSILNDESFERHDKHIRDLNTSCNVCHDPHGISSAQGISTENSHLINFDINIVNTDGDGQMRFVDLGNNHGYCQIKCHGVTHTSDMDY